MFTQTDLPKDTEDLYRLLVRQTESLITDSPSVISSLANCCALLYQSLTDISWCGFYLTRENQLILGPFQGKAACTVIPFGKGVCGTAAERKQVQLVPNVNEFPGHIACDSASKSEIVLPMILDGDCVGVLDIDSSSYNRFSNDDLSGLLSITDVLVHTIPWKDLKIV